MSLSSPTLGAVVSGTITLQALAADNVAVAGVQFQGDGANIGPEDSAAPYAATLDTTQLPNGALLDFRDGARRGWEQPNLADGHRAR
ncbi:MAG: Ig-like domain-containing protein [Bryobacterales bacterium]